jgi:hypothetical protein
MAVFRHSARMRGRITDFALGTREGAPRTVKSGLGFNNVQDNGENEMSNPFDKTTSQPKTQDKGSPPKTVLRRLPVDEFGVHGIALNRFHAWHGFDVHRFYAPTQKPSSTRHAFVLECLSACLNAMEDKGRLPPAIIGFSDWETQPTVLLICPGASTIDQEIDTSLCSEVLALYSDGEPIALELHSDLPTEHKLEHSAALRRWTTRWGAERFN